MPLPPGPKTQPLTPLAVDDLGRSMRSAERRDDVLIALLRAAMTRLDDVQIWAVRADELCGVLALSGAKLETDEIRQRKLPLDGMSVVSRAARDGILYIGPLDEDDPWRPYANDAFATRGLVVLPVQLGAKTVCLLIGHPRGKSSRQLRDGLVRAAYETSRALQQLILSSKHGAPARQDGDALSPRATSQLGDISPAPAPSGRRPRRVSIDVANWAEIEPLSLSDEPLDEQTFTEWPPWDHLAKAARHVEEQVFLLTRRKPPRPTEQPPPRQQTPRSTRIGPTGPLPPVREADSARGPAGGVSPALEPAGGVSPVPPTAAPPTAAGSPEAAARRSYPRFPLHVKVDRDSDHNFFCGLSDDIADTGLFVATYAPAELGDHLEIAFSVGGVRRTFRAQCRVRWVREYDKDADEGIPGMGLAFEKLEPEAETAITTFVAQRQPIFYED